MRVAINARTTLGRKTGVGIYTDHLLRHLPRFLEPHELFFHPPHRWMQNLFRMWYRRTAKRSAKPTNRPNPSGSGFRERLVEAILPWGMWLLSRYDRAVLRKGRFHLYHEPNYIPIECDIPTITTIHDLSILRTDWHPRRRVLNFEAGLPRTIRQSVHILTDTEFSRHEIAEHFRLPLDRITNTSCGVRSDLRPMSEEEYRPTLQQLGLPPQYLLHVGTIEPRKNLLMLMRAYVDLPSSLRAEYPLVLVGQWGWRYEEVADYYHRTAKHHGVLQMGYVPDDALGAVYNGACAFLFPTLYEGFGIPPLEMMACGGAVIASTAGAVVEVVGRHAAFVHPQDVEGWREAMRRILTDVDWRRELQRGVIAHARHYTWERTAEATANIYRRVLGLAPETPRVPAKAA